jgi:ATP synthase protein I
MKSKQSVGKALVLITQLSINMLVPIFMCLFIGIWLDNRLGTAWLTLVFLVLGVIAAIRAMFVTLQPLLKGEREKKDEAYQKQFDERYKRSE